MKRVRMGRLAGLLLAAVLLLTGCTGWGNAAQAAQDQLDNLLEEGAGGIGPAEDAAAEGQDGAIDAYGAYTTRDDVALYIHTYGRLPENFITKAQAREYGWNGGSLEEYSPGCCIGGDRFGNYEGLLPEKTGRVYTECDIDTLGADARGAKRIVFSNDGLVYFTDDHYGSFTLLYGED